MTRIVTGTIRTPTGEPWPGYRVAFVVLPSTYTLDATYPMASADVVTDEDGTLTVTLETGIQYEVRLSPTGPGALSTRVEAFRVVIPAGDGPISLEAVRALGSPVPVPDPSILDAVIAAVEARLIPPGGQPGEALVKAESGDYVLAWGTADAHYSEGS